VLRGVVGGLRAPEKRRPPVIDMAVQVDKVREYLEKGKGKPGSAATPGCEHHWGDPYTSELGVKFVLLQKCEQCNVARLVAD
jgi:hypothetical protein